jgi:poly [ADP-ribose] polymerase
MAIIKKWRGICANISGNNNKFWEIELHDNSDVVTRWGRIAEDNKAQSKTFPGKGEYFFDSKIREKTNKSNPDERYTEARTVESVGGNAKVIQSSNLVEIAKREINSNSPETLALIERLAAANVHNIVSQTSMTFNKVTGMFETPLGIVTADAISEARDYLTKIGDIVSQQSWSNPDFARNINQYMRLIPSDFGRQRVQPQDLFPNLSSVQNQNDILDSLESSLQMVMTAPVDSAAPAMPKLFETTLHLVEDGKVYDKMNRLYNATRQSIHAASAWNIHKIYKLEIAKMDKAFRDRGLKIGNIQQLVHGSKIGNLLSIMKNGFMIPPAQSSHCTGRLIGNGVYTSDQWSKALNYAMGTAPGQKGSYERVGFLFYCDIAMGKVYEPRSLNERFPVPGYDSVFAKGGGYTTLRNNEMVVYSCDQINPQYLIEFK